MKQSKWSEPVARPALGTERARRRAIDDWVELEDRMRSDEEDGRSISYKQPME